MKKLIAALSVLATLNAQSQVQVLSVKLSDLTFYSLPYSYTALEPTIDANTVEIHYSRHHRAYFDNFMKSVAGTDLLDKTLNEIFANVSSYPVAVRNNGGGYYNHVLYWEMLKPDKDNRISEALKQAIARDFGTIDALKNQISDAANKRFGSGWAWLSVSPDGKLFVSSTQNQDNPLMDVTEKRGTPIIAIDVWEHAYYLKYQNKRAEYVALIWNAINWDVVSELFANAAK
ncbi:MAG: superoxide dismutase [Bacteroidales bacterium]